MENASKALLMAGSVLLTVIIVSALIVMFNRISRLKNTEQNSEELSSVVEFNKKYEAYNRKMLYGTDIISIANMVDDYNKREHEEKAYGDIVVKVTIGKKITEINDLNIGKSGVYSASDIRSGIKDLTDKIDNQGKSMISGGKGSITCLEAYKLSGEDLYENYGIDKNNGELEYYRNLQNGIKSFKRKIFTCTNVKYDENTGRITEMQFTEVN